MSQTQPDGLQKVTSVQSDLRERKQGARLCCSRAHCQRVLINNDVSRRRRREGHHRRRHRARDPEPR